MQRSYIIYLLEKLDMYKADIACFLSFLSSISLTVFVSDKGSPRKPSSNYTILFNIATNPSSTPFLLPSLTEVTVYENASIGDVVSVINSSLSADNFSIIFQLPNGGHFKIDNQVSAINNIDMIWSGVNLNFLTILDHF